MTPTPTPTLTWPAVGHDDGLGILLLREQAGEVDLVFDSVELDLCVVIRETVDPLLVLPPRYVPSAPSSMKLIQ